MGVDPSVAEPAGLGCPGGLFRTVDHVAVAVRSIEAAVVLFHTTWGSEFIIGGDHPGLRMRTVQLALPTGSKVELLMPLDAGSPLHEHLEKRGEGPHHLTVLVDSLSEAIAAHAASGFKIAGIETSSARWKEAFVVPGSGFGLLVQLAETPYRWDVAVPGLTLDDVLQGRVTWMDYRPWLDDGRGGRTELGTGPGMLRRAAGADVDVALRAAGAEA